ncbi:MAG: hypothetical protein QG675_683 [Patescibacteria group bacterium]|nr:hypothetical protein [Patescibacteria group bacterium]
MGLFSGLEGPAGLVDRGQRGAEPAVELVQGLQLLLEALEHLLSAVDVGLEAVVALGEHHPVVGELGLHRLDVAGDAVDADHQGCGNRLARVLVELGGQVRAVLELLGESENRLDLGVVPGGGTEVLDGLFDALGHAASVETEPQLAGDHDERDQDQDRRDGDGGQDGVGGFHSEPSMFLFGCSRGISRSV